MKNYSLLITILTMVSFSNTSIGSEIVKTSDLKMSLNCEMETSRGTYPVEVKSDRAGTVLSLAGRSFTSKQIAKIIIKDEPTIGYSFQINLGTAKDTISVSAYGFNGDGETEFKVDNYNAGEVISFDRQVFDVKTKLRNLGSTVECSGQFEVLN